MSDKRAAKPIQGVPPELMSAWQRWEMNSIEAQPVFTSANIADLARRSADHTGASLVDETELARLRFEARQTGHAEGYQEGYAKGQAEGHAAAMLLAQQDLQSLKTLLLALPSAMHAADREVADDLMTLALEIARQMVREALTTNPQHILTLVRELLRMEPTLNGTPRLLMHVDDAALVQQHLADDLQAAGWRIRTDLSIQRGGCRVHAAGGALDATLETRWKRVEAAFQRDAEAPREDTHG